MQSKHLILGAALVVLAGALAWRATRVDAATTDTPIADTSHEPAALPRLVELGSDSCASCRAMIPVLDELRTSFKGQLDVDFIDVWKYPDAAEPFNVSMIPTQVFLASDGVELARHQGFFSADEISARWDALGYPLRAR